MTLAFSGIAVPISAEFATLQSPFAGQTNNHNPNKTSQQRMTNVLSSGRLARSRTHIVPGEQAKI
jgi:hypothetical protein